MIDGYLLTARVAKLADPEARHDMELTYIAVKIRRERWWKVLRRDPCAYCGERHKRRDMTVDHIVPKAKGGGHWENVTGACRPCNSDKGPMSLLDFLLYRAAVDEWLTLQGLDEWMVWSSHRGRDGS